MTVYVRVLQYFQVCLQYGYGSESGCWAVVESRRPRRRWLLVGAAAQARLEQDTANEAGSI